MIASYGEGLKNIAELAGFAFSVEGIKNLIESLGALGTQIEHASRTLGISTTGIQELGFVAKASGTSADALTHTMATLQTNLDKAQNGITPTAHALQALGLSAKELASLSIDQQITKLGDAFGRYADGPRKAALANELVRGGAETLLPVLADGAEGYKRLTAAAIDAGTVMTSQTVRALDTLSLRSGTLRASLTALGGTLVGLASQSLGGFSEALTKTSSDLTALAATGHLGEYFARVAANAWHTFALEVAEAGTAIKDFFTASPAQATADYAAAEAAIDSFGKNAVAQTDAIVSNAIAAYRNLIAAAGIEGNVSERPPAPASATPNMQALSAQITQYETMAKAAGAGFAQLKELYAADVTAHRISVDQEKNDLLAALDFRHTAEDAAYDAALKAAQGDMQKYAELQKQKSAADNAWKLEHEKIIDEARKKDEQAWQSMLSPVESAFNSQLRSLLAGTETWSQAMKKIFGDLVISVIEGFEKMAIAQAASSLAAKFGGPANLAISLLGGGGNAVETTANTTALATLTAAVSANTVALGGETVASSAAAAGSSAGGIGSIFASIASIFGFAEGTDRVVSPGVAFIHRNETIIPAARGSGPYTGASNGNGNGDTHFHFEGGVIGTQAWINQMRPQLVAAINGYRNLNPSTT